MSNRIIYIILLSTTEYRYINIFIYKRQGTTDFEKHVSWAVKGYDFDVEGGPVSGESVEIIYEGWTLGN